MTKIKIVDPLSERWQKAILDLLQRLDVVDHDITDAKRDAGKRLAGVRDGDVRLEDSALSPLVRLTAKREALSAALEEARAKLEAAPGKMAAYEASLPPLAEALAERDRLRAGVEGLLGALYEGLMGLRAANESAYTALRVAARAYREAGGSRVPGLQRPSFPAIRFNSAAVRALARSCPFAAGPLLFHGDTSGRSQGILASDGNEETD